MASTASGCTSLPTSRPQVPRGGFGAGVASGCTAVGAGVASGATAVESEVRAGAGIGDASGSVVEVNTTVERFTPSSSTSPEHPENEIITWSKINIRKSHDLDTTAILPYQWLASNTDLRICILSSGVAQRSWKLSWITVTRSSVLISL